MSKERGEPSHDDDRALVQAAQQGDDQAFGALVERHQTRMLNIAYRMTGDYDEACEVVQDAFLSAYRAIRKFRAEATFSTWVYGIVVNAAKTRLKRTKTLRQTTLSLDDPAANPGGRLLGAAEAPDGSALELLERKEIQAKVQHCIGQLNEEYREVIVLRDTLGFSYEEIRGMLRLPEGTIKSRLFRARDAMRRCLKTVLGEL